MSLRPAKYRGFTLLELVICTSIVFLLAGTPTLMIVRVQSQQDLLQRRMEMAFETQEALRVWREDVQRAVAVRVNEDGSRMEVRTRSTVGDERTVYEQRGSMLVRLDSDSEDSPRELAHGIEKLTLRRRKGAWEISWVAVYDDGSRRIRWQRGGNASPMLQNGSTIEATP